MTSYFINNCLDEYGDNENEDTQEFLKRFFPDGLPTFRVETEKTSTDYLYNNVFVDDKKVARILRNPKDSGKAFEELLNGKENNNG